MIFNRLVIHLLIFFKLLFASSFVYATILQKAEYLYAIGNYKESAQLARTVHSAPAYSLAAKAILAEATFVALDKDKFDLFQQAINDAKAALELDDSYLYAHLQIALALGSLADLKHPISAYLNGYATKGKQHLDIALSLAPDNVWVNGLLGIWHIQIVNRLNSLLAENLYDANLNDGLSFCEKAQQLSNDDLQVIYGCAISLYDLNEEVYKKQACQILEFIVTKKPVDATENYLIKLAENRLKEKEI